MFRKPAIALGSLMALAAATGVFAQGGAQAPVAITRGTVSTTAAEWPNIVANKKGIYTKHGLKVDQALISPTTITPSLIGGSIQIGFINATQLVLATESGADLVALGQGMDPAPYWLVTSKDIKSFADLKGKTVSLAEQGDVYAEATRQILRKSGLDPDKDVNFRYGGNSNQRMAALVAGAVNAVPLLSPQERLLQQQGFNALAFYPDHFPKLALSLTAVRRSWANANPDTVRRFMRAQAEAIGWLYDPANKEEAIKLLMAETNSDRDSAGYSYDLFITKLKLFPPNGCIQTQGLDVMLGILASINPKVKAGQSAAKYVDTQYCPN